jgi:MFS family permease
LTATRIHLVCDLDDVVRSGVQSHERRLLIAVLIAQSVNAAEATGVVTAMPAVAKDLQGDRLYGAAFTVYMLASVVAGVMAGQESDRRSPRRAFLIAVACFTIGSLVAALAPTMWWVIVGRAIQGLGGGAFYNLGFVAIARGIAVEHRPKALAWQSTAWVVPGLLAPFVAGYVSDVFSWRWVFAGLIPLVPVLLLLALPEMSKLRPPPDLVPGPNRFPGAMALAISGGVLLTGLDQLDQSWGWPLVIVGTIATLAALHNLLPHGWWRAAVGLPALVVFRLLLNASFFGADSFLPYASTRVHNSGTKLAGFLITGGTLSWTVASWLQSRVRARIPAHHMLAAGAALVAGCSALAITVAQPNVSTWWTFPIWTLAGFGVGFAFTGSTMVATELGEEFGFGEVGANLEIADGFGFALATGIGGALVAAGDRSGRPPSSIASSIFVMTSLIGVVAAVVGLRVRRARVATATIAS